MIRGPFLQLLLLCCLATAIRAQDLVEYQSDYYIIRTDLPPEGALEAQIRMNLIAREYMNRTRGFSGVIHSRMPFYLYADPEKYYATGAPRTSGGYFDGTSLVALAEDLGPRTWHRVQHEAFHQFADQVIRGKLPPWLNEGLAEYFGEAVFTGDGFVSGVIPQWRLKRIRETIEKKEFPSLREMMQVPIEQWNSELAIRNYDQAWSMVQFLAHGGDGKYQEALGRFVAALGDNRPWQQAWRDIFGDTGGFEDRWRGYWTSLPDNPTIDLYAQANVATLTAFLARGVSQNQQFANLKAFEEAADAGTIKHLDQNWLPPSLLKQAMEQYRILARAGFTYTLTTPAGSRLPQLLSVTPTGKRITGRYTLRNGSVITTSADFAPNGSR